MQAERNLEIVKLILKGQSYTETAKQYNVTKQRIHQIAKAFGVVKKRARGQSKRLFGVKGERGRLNPEEIKKLVLRYYGRGKLACVKCGYKDIRALTIDHINNDGAEHRKECTGVIYRWLIKNNFPTGYQTLCMNCQWIKRAELYN